ncbi:MAG: topoisomerase [Flavobacterium sp. BFFFF2]|nr:MAG: topoisomerase [Flavobacterium sp. BFFFF2]
MALTKDEILSKTNRGLDVLRHYLGSNFQKVGKAFKNPFYPDTKASCYVHFDKRSQVFKFKDFGSAEYSGDCFFIVGNMFGLDCADKEDFYKILELINQDLGLFLLDNSSQLQALPLKKDNRFKPKETGIEDFEVAEIKEPYLLKEFSKIELDYWGQYGINKSVLNQYGVQALERFSGINKEGKEYQLLNTEQEPIFGYPGRKHIKIYRPKSKLRFLYAGEISEQYVFGLDQLPVRGDILFITGGEKDVLSLVSKGFHAICFNSETANIPKKLLRTMNYRFKHITLIYDTDETGKKAMDKLEKEFVQFGVNALHLPLNGSKESKDVSDFFRLGHSAEELMMLFCEMLDTLYDETMSVMRACEIDFDHPPKAPEPLITINNVTIGAPGNLICITGSEGSGKTNYLGGIISGALRKPGDTIDTLGTWVQHNPEGKSVILYDTEQSEHQLHKNLSYILHRANYKKPPNWFRPFGLVGISRKDRMQCILESMDKFFYEYGGIHMVVIDGIADLLGSVNDEEASVHLIEELYRLAAIYKSCVICVLHTSPSGMKLRGHLGSEMQRKASGILSVEKDDKTNASVVKALKVRDGSPLDVPLIQFGWDTQAGKHVYQGEKTKEETSQSRNQDLKDLAIDLFSKKESRTYTELMNAIMESLSVKERMARNYIKHMKDNGIIEKGQGSTAEFRLVSAPF